MRPENPSARKNSTVRKPPSPAPTTTTCTMRPLVGDSWSQGWIPPGLGDLVPTSAYEQLALPRPQLSALFLGQASPDAVGLSCGQCMVAALLENGAALADLLGSVGAARSC